MYELGFENLIQCQKEKVTTSFQKSTKSPITD